MPDPITSESETSGDMPTIGEGVVIGATDEVE
jgi:hypothetical protein